MRAVLQRVNYAEVSINESVHAKISNGIMVLLGIKSDDQLEDIKWLVSKIVNMRIFSDEEGLMNLSIQDIKGELLIISQFTLFASTKKGNRPGFINAARPEYANQIFEEFIKQLKEIFNGKIEKGVFGADMQIRLLNNGPVTIFIDSKNKE
ncbi:MAG: D-aminoacyl-tRNA deacylase [Saprospiraceae bacterium]